MYAAVSPLPLDCMCNTTQIVKVRLTTSNQGPIHKLAKSATLCVGRGSSL